MTASKFERWIGKKQVTTDVITERRVEQFRASLSPHLKEHDAREAPLLFHWCLAPHAVPCSELGEDGHPVKGDFLPPVSLPRRMWAAGEVFFHGGLAVGDTVERTSKIQSIQQKAGRSGEMWFVEVGHVITTERGIALEEIQTIVYREAASGAVVPPDATIAAASDDTVVDFSAVRLFRYSALTFNGHRIHYDWPYAVEMEGYDGLVVHGPLQATLLAHAAAMKSPKDIRSIKFRGVAPLIGPSQGAIRTFTDADEIRCCMCDQAGRMTMELIAA